MVEALCGQLQYFGFQVEQIPWSGEQPASDKPLAVLFIPAHGETTPQDFEFITAVRGTRYRVAAGDDTSRTDTAERLPAEELNLQSVWDAEWQRNLVEVAIARVKARIKARPGRDFAFVVKNGCDRLEASDKYVDAKRAAKEA